MSGGALPTIKSFSAAEVDLVFILADGKEIYMGVAENFNWTEEYNAELQRAIGSFYPIGTLVHGGSGSFSWGSAQTSDDLMEQGFIPDVDDLGKWEPFTIQVVDRRRNKLLRQLNGCAIQSDGGAATENGKLMENVSGLCAKVMRPHQLN